MPIIVLLLLAAIGLPVISDSAKPGDLLFPVDLTVEKVQDALSFNDGDKAKLKAAHVKERLHELKELSKSGKVKGIGTAISNIEQNAKEAVDAARKSGDKALALDLQKEFDLDQAELGDLENSENTDSLEDGLLVDAKETLEIEKERVGAVAEPEKSALHLETALRLATKEASDSAKKVEEIQKSSASTTSSDKPKTSFENKQAIETHNQVVTQETTTIKTEQTTTPTSTAPTTTETSGSTTQSVTIEVQNSLFKQPNIVVKKGVKLTVEFRNDDPLATALSFDAYGLSTSLVSKDGRNTITFTADKNSAFRLSAKSSVAGQLTVQ